MHLCGNIFHCALISWALICPHDDSDICGFFPLQWVVPQHASSLKENQIFLPVSPHDCPVAPVTTDQVCWAALQCMFSNVFICPDCGTFLPLCPLVSVQWPPWPGVLGDSPVHLLISFHMPRLWDFSSIVSPHECPVAPLDQVCRAGPNHPTGSTPDQSHHATYALSAYMYNIIYSHYSITLRYGPTVAPVGSTKSLGVHCTVKVGHFFVPHEGLKKSMYNVFWRN